MKATLQQDERSPLDSKKFFGRRGDKVTVVNQNGPVAIVQDSHGERFPVKIANLNIIHQ